MSDLTHEQLLELASKTLSRGNDVAEVWTGTLYEKQIKMQQEQVTKSLDANDFGKIRKFVLDLARFLDRAERECNEH